ncbi:thiamine pyrophosphate-dependent enzyme [Nakamurella endophytica]|nr:thiamine pyrophosphate-dependent enzyme [Nakamurella endophytica]
MGGRRSYPHSRTLPDVDDAAFARSLGLEAVNVDRGDQLGPAWERALAADRPTVLDVRCDPDVPPAPPHTTVERAKATLGAIVHGDEDAWGVVQQGVEEKVEQFLPGTKQSPASRAGPA